MKKPSLFALIAVVAILAVAVSACTPALATITEVKAPTPVSNTVCVEEANARPSVPEEVVETTYADEFCDFADHVWGDPNFVVQDDPMLYTREDVCEVCGYKQIQMYTRYIPLDGTGLKAPGHPYDMPLYLIYTSDMGVDVDF